MIEKLKAENTDSRREAANKVRLAAKSVQRQALPLLIDRLANERDGQVRLAVLDTLISLGPDAAPAVPALLELFEPTSAAVARRPLTRITGQPLRWRVSANRR